MRSIMLAVSFLKKQWVMNVVLVVEILISVIMLSELFLFVSDRMDNQRAAEELQNNQLYVLSEFEYYAPQEERVIEALRADEAIQSIGKVDISSCTWNAQYFQLGLYNADLIGLHAPKCASGAWLPTEGGEYSGYPAVVSADAGLQVGDAAEILVADQYRVSIEVVGVLATPTQYLFPTGMSANVDSIISHSPAILVNQALFPQLPPNPDTADVPKSLFLISNLNKEEMIAKYNRYGQIQAINDMVASYVETSNGLIRSEALLFVLFVLLAAIVILSTEVIHSIQCQKNYTIYYLVGMKWHQCVWIELTRHGILLFFIAGSIALLDKFGALQTAWMTDARRNIFYIVLLVYLVLVFFSTSAFFLWKLLHRDIIASLRNLQGGE